MLVEHDTNNEEQFTDIKTTVQNLHGEVGKLRSDIEELRASLQSGLGAVLGLLRRA